MYTAMEKKIEPGQRKGTVHVPPSKSDAQRAYLAAALAGGESVLFGWGLSDDEQAMLEAVRELGADVAYCESGELVIRGIEAFPDEAFVSAGESGLGVRLLTSVCATFPGKTHLSGTGSLNQRPMGLFEHVLPAFGVSCSTNKGALPLTVEGPMTGASITIDGSLSSQFVSGLLMALPLASGESTLRVDNLKSRPYVEMTLQTLHSFGIHIQSDANDTFRISGGQHYRSAEYTIDADWSSASYWLVAAAIGHAITVSGLRSTSLQADKALLHILEEAGCRIAVSDDGITIDGTYREAFEADLTDCPDLFPALVTFAVYCKGTSVIRGAERLLHKESNRGLALQQEFGKLGVQIDLSESEMTVHGKGSVSGGTVSAHNDHRIAMCLGIAALCADGPVVIEGAEAVAKSYPAFWNVLEEL
jgi:3-phosphoshikimate 1-carboxyvinyltransferase